MVIKYRGIEGVLIFAKQIKNRIYEMEIKNLDDMKIHFTCDIYDIKLVDCIGNESFLSEIKK